MSVNLITVAISFQFLPGGTSMVTLVAVLKLLFRNYNQIVHREFVFLQVLVIFLFASLTNQLWFVRLMNLDTHVVKTWIIKPNMEPHW